MNLQDKTLEELKAMDERLWAVVKQTETAHNIASRLVRSIETKYTPRARLEAARLELLAQGYTAPSAA
jgi:hypothetical protein